MMLRAVLVGSLFAVTLTAGQPTAVAGDAEFGRVWAKDRVLRDGCHNYRYQYRVTSPEHEWALETFLLDPDRHQVGAGEMLFNADPERGTGTFRLCRNATSSGQFKIKGKLTYDDGYDEYVVWIEPGFFRLRRASS